MFSVTSSLSTLRREKFEQQEKRRQEEFEAAKLTDELIEQWHREEPIELTE